MTDTTPPTPPADETPITPETVVTPVMQEGTPATGHLNSAGGFETINPAGTIYKSAEDQIDVGSEVPPSLERIREKGEGFTNQDEAGADPNA